MCVGGVWINASRFGQSIIYNVRNVSGFRPVGTSPSSCPRRSVSTVKLVVYEGFTLLSSMSKTVFDRSRAQRTKLAALNWLRVVTVLSPRSPDPPPRRPPGPYPVSVNNLSFGRRALRRPLRAPRAAGRPVPARGGLSRPRKRAQCGCSVCVLSYLKN
ncbi:hypothetical protein EVAR_70870_1 [Eumeta japonica]|uniref:Uncharacterized protein n=1 Tax=Eumeta variegata TaxID=151549 RepID=A0A4C2ABG1_EUMVA|nr:hypothetical protein EVAR_70870_1 [Eumeta japonica]